MLHNEAAVVQLSSAITTLNLYEESRFANTVLSWLASKKAPSPSKSPYYDLASPFYSEPCPLYIQNTERINQGIGFDRGRQ